MGPADISPSESQSGGALQMGELKKRVSFYLTEAWGHLLYSTILSVDN